MDNVQAEAKDVITQLIAIGAPLEAIAGLEPDGSVSIESMIKNTQLVLSMYGQLYAARTKYLGVLRDIAAIVLPAGEAKRVENEPRLAAIAVAELAKRLSELIPELPQTTEVKSNAD